MSLNKNLPWPLKKVCPFSLCTGAATVEWSSYLVVLRNNCVEIKVAKSFMSAFFWKCVDSQRGLLLNSAADISKMFVSDDMMQNILAWTNRHADQIKEKSPNFRWITLEADEFYAFIAKYWLECKNRTRCHAVAGRTARCRYNFRHNGIVQAVTLVQHGFLVYRPTSAQQPFKC